MRIADPDVAEIVAEREDRRRHRMAAWLRRRHRRRRPVDRWDALEIKRAASDFAEMRSPSTPDAASRLT